MIYFTCFKAQNLNIIYNKHTDIFTQKYKKLAAKIVV